MPENGGDLGGFTIGAREIYDKLAAIQSDVRSLVEADVRVVEKLSDHEDRIRELEKWRWGMPAALLTGLIGAMGTIAAVMKGFGVI